MTYFQLLKSSILGGLSSCRDCHKEVSYQAEICPNCGAPKPGKRWWVRFTSLLLIFLLGTLYLLIVRYHEEIDYFFGHFKETILARL